MTAVITPSAPADSRRAATPTPLSPPAGTRRGRIWPLARSIVFWTHVALGVSGGVIIFVMSVTGALLGFEKQLVARFDGVARVAPVSKSTVRLSVDTLLTRGVVPLTDVASVVLKADRAEPVSVRFRARDKAPLLLDPYTAAVIAAPPRGKVADFMGWVRGWHRWLGVTQENRPLARVFTGAANFAFLLLVLSGLVIWWPKRLTPAAFRAITVFRPTLRGKPRDFNWHNTLGFWSALPLACVVASGVFMSYQWPAQWLDRLWGTEKERAAAIKAMAAPPEREGARREGGPSPESRNVPRGDGANRSAPRTMAGFNQMIATAQIAKPAWQSITVTPAGARDSVVQVAVAEGNTYRPDLKTQYFFNATTGAAVRVTNYDSLSTGRQIRSWYRFTHTGEMFGITGQAIATFVSAVGAMLVYTGLALALRRLAAFVRRRRTMGVRTAKGPAVGAGR